MTLRKIITLPDPFLRKKAKEVTKVTLEIKELLNDMLETMYDANGIGLAATQVRDNRRLIVMDCGKETGTKMEENKQDFIPNPMKMINPELIFKSNDLIEREEGCLSIPGHQAKINRSKYIKVSYVDEFENKKEIETDGLLATCIQHEIDHLNGILFIDYLSRLKKETILRKVAKDHYRKKDV